MEFDVTLYYSSFIKRRVEADSPSEAIKKARDEQDRLYGSEVYHSGYLPEIMENLQPWKEADEAEKIG
jgi:hypothetical protein